jgi:hypothetical protein
MNKEKLKEIFLNWNSELLRSKYLVMMSSRTSQNQAGVQQSLFGE